jgi:ATP-dependent Clp protease adaptor protein ClpS
MKSVYVKSKQKEAEEYEDTALDEGTVAKIILYNDDYNTFDWVIECLIKYCKHDAIQAEQCAWIVHNTGKAQVKSGEYEKMSPIKDALCEAGLNAVIEW